MKKLCEKYNKYMSGGSDYHADFKPGIKIGIGINNNLDIQKNSLIVGLEKLKGEYYDGNKI